MRKITHPLSLQHIFQQQILHSMHIKKQLAAQARGPQRCHATMPYHGQRGLLGLKITAPRDTTVRLGRGFQLVLTEILLKPNEPRWITGVKCTLCSN